MGVTEKEEKYFSCCFIALLVFGLMLLGVCMVSRDFWRIYWAGASIAVGLFVIAAIVFGVYTCFKKPVKYVKIEDSLIVLADGRNEYAKHGAVQSVCFFADDEKLKDGEFAGLPIERVLLPEKLEKIPSYTFANCEKLADISIPATVTEIGEYAFAGCRALKSITIPAAVAKTGEYAFCGCTGLEKVELPNGLEAISFGTFAKCNRCITLVFDCEESVWKEKCAAYKTWGLTDACKVQFSDWGEPKTIKAWLEGESQ
mgnify:CR=1 FL=1